MIKLIFKNSRDEVIDLINDNEVRLTSMTGVSSAVNISRQSLAGRDGSIPGTITRPERFITVNFRLRTYADGEKAMHKMFRFFEGGGKGTMIMEGRRGSSQIDYIVQECTIPPNQPPPMQGLLILICPDPYFRSGKEEEQLIAGTYSTFRFPFHFPEGRFYISRRIESLFATIYNSGEAETDMNIEFRATARVVNPALIDVKTGETAKLNFTMEAGDLITVNSKKGEKSVTLTRNGKDTNIINYIRHPFEFFTLNSGENTFKYDADSGINNLDIKVRYTARFGAIYTNVSGGNIPVTTEELERLIEDTARIVRRKGLND